MCSELPVLGGAPILLSDCMSGAIGLEKREEERKPH